MMKNIDDNLQTGASGDDARALSISALMDDALAGPDADAALAAAAQPDGLERWQLYHLIGDTLRAPELAAHHRPALLEGVRAAMRQPMPASVSAAPPQPAARPEAANDGVFRWKLASGFAAVVAVAAIGWHVWGGVAMPTGQQLVLRSAPPAAPLQIAQTGAPEINVAALDPQVVRLLAEHRRMAAVGDGTSGFLRNALFEEPLR